MSKRLGSKLAGKNGVTLENAGAPSWVKAEKSFKPLRQLDWEHCVLSSSQTLDFNGGELRPCQLQISPFLVCWWFAVVAWKSEAAGGAILKIHKLQKMENRTRLPGGSRARSRAPLGDLTARENNRLGGHQASTAAPGPLKPQVSAMTLFILGAIFGQHPQIFWPLCSRNQLCPADALTLVTIDQILRAMNWEEPNFLVNFWNFQAKN